MGNDAKLRPNLKTWFSKVHWKERIVTFDPSWYLVCMGTGIVVQLLASNFPYPAGWLNRLGYVFWILDVCLFTFFTLMSLVRLFLYPKVALGIFDDFQQTCYLGAVPTAWETVVTGVVIFYSNHNSAVYVAQVFFWIAVVMTLLVTCGGVYVMHKRQGQHQLNEVTGAWLLVFIPMIVAGALGSNLAVSVSLQNGAVVIVVSFLMLSLGLGLSFLVMGIYFWRLMACQLPARDVIVSTFVLVGPVSMSAYVILNLSKALAQYVVQESFTFRQPWEPSINATSIAVVAEGILWIGVTAALFLLGIGTFFLIEAFASVLTQVPKTFNIGLWSFVFPCGVYANAFCRLSTLLRNEGMKGWAATCVVGTVLLWLMCAACTTYKAVWQGKLFFAPGLQGWAEQNELNKLDRSPDEPALQNSSSLQTSRDIRSRGVSLRRRPINDGTYQSEDIASTESGSSNGNGNLKERSSV